MSKYHTVLVLTFIVQSCLYFYQFRLCIIFIHLFMINRAFFFFKVLGIIYPKKLFKTLQNIHHLLTLQLSPKTFQPHNYLYLLSDRFLSALISFNMFLLAHDSSSHSSSFSASELAKESSDDDSSASVEHRKLHLVLWIDGYC